MQILAERLKEVRENLGISQKNAAKALLITNTSLSNYELNISTPSPEVLVSMARYYKVSLDYLFGISDVKDIEREDGVVYISSLDGFESLSDKNKDLVSALVKALKKSENGK